MRKKQQLLIIIVLSIFLVGGTQKKLGIQGNSAMPEWQKELINNGNDENLIIKEDSVLVLGFIKSAEIMTSNMLGGKQLVAPISSKEENLMIDEYLQVAYHNALAKLAASIKTTITEESKKAFKSAKVDKSLIDNAIAFVKIDSIKDRLPLPEYYYEKGYRSYSNVYNRMAQKGAGKIMDPVNEKEYKYYKCCAFLKISFNIYKSIFIDSYEKLKKDANEINNVNAANVAEILINKWN